MSAYTEKLRLAEQQDWLCALCSGRMADPRECSVHADATCHEVHHWVLVELPVLPAHATPQSYVTAGIVLHKQPHIGHAATYVNAQGSKVAVHKCCGSSARSRTMHRPDGLIPTEAEVGCLAKRRAS